MSNIGVAMFTVAQQDAALAYYTDKLGFEVRSDTNFGEHGEMRWLEVAPPGSHARLALNPPMGSAPGGGSIGVPCGCRKPILAGQMPSLADPQPSLGVVENSSLPTAEQR